MSRLNSQSVAESAKRVSGVLVGRFDHNLDPKKRFTIPSEWRAAMGDPDSVFIMPDSKERCLCLIPPEEMEARLAKLRERSLFDPAIVPYLEKIGSLSEQLTLDVQGRIRISDKLLRFANLTTTVAMLGAVRMVKLWDPAALAPEEEIDQAGLAAALAATGF